MALLTSILRPRAAPRLHEQQAVTAANGMREGGWRLRDPDRRRGAPEAPLVTVVTVCFNSVRTIADTIESVAGQSYPSIEHVIIDGGSTDGTVELLQREEERIAYWRSEPDDGIYDAFNKGIVLARGESVQILNSDDWMEPDQIERAVAALLRSGADFVHGDIWLHGWRGSDVRIRGDACWDRKVRRTMPTIHQATVLARRSVYERVGLFRTDLRIASDYDWFIRLAKAGVVGAYDPKVVAHMRAGGASTAQQRRTIAEGFACAWNNGDRLLPCAMHWTKRWLWPNGAPTWTDRLRSGAQATRRALRERALATANAVPVLRSLPGRSVVKRLVGFRPEPAQPAAARNEGRLLAFIEVRDLDGGLDASSIERLLEEGAGLGPVAAPAACAGSPLVRQASHALRLGGAETMTVADQAEAGAAGCRSVLLEDEPAALRSWSDFPILLLVGPRGLRVERTPSSR